MAKNRVTYQRCPACNRIGLMAVPPDAKSGPGSLCPKCGWWLADKKEFRHRVVCADCKDDDLGTKATVDDPNPPSIICIDCSRKRLAAGAEADPGQTVRHTILCSGGCGKVQGWRDIPEGHPKNDDPGEIGHCEDCAPKVPPPVVDEDAQALKRKLAAGIADALKRGEITQADAIVGLAKLLQ